MIDSAAGAPSPGLERMLAWIEGLPNQLRDAIEAADRAGWPPAMAAPRAVYVGGMGGSAMAGLASTAILHDDLRVPVRVQMDPRTPGWVGPGVVVVAVSYSGETWEAREMLQDAAARGATALAVSSGGGLQREAAARGIPHFAVPGGYAPRAAFGWMAVAVGLAVAASAAPERVSRLREDMRGAAGLLDEELRLWRAGTPLPGRDPAGLAAELDGQLACFAATGERSWPAALRWRNQVMENGKQTAIATAYPELAHNEIVGWEDFLRIAPARLIVLDDEEADQGMRGRVIAASLAEWTRLGGQVTRIPARGTTTAGVLLSHVLLADRTSAELAQRRAVDPLPVEAIARVKDACGKELDR